MKRWAGAAGVVALLGFAAASPAYADPIAMQERVDYAIATNPGGIQTGWNEVTWDGGDMILTLAPEEDPAAEENDGAIGRAAVGSCANGTYCVYSSPNLGGSKLTFVSCTSHSVSALGSAVRLVANGRSSGTVVGMNGVLLVLVANPSAYVNTTATVTHVGC